ncbi:phage tail assembly protein [Phaeobacter inhibens]|uniref:phage tail assembly protein n=1 Tax=Phaeobacter inhibens TaxID=221822 RepID=UPI0026E258EB|nr:phage tail assembly protein [Phaeobacter inhibens]MDO6756924.1 phage tail assembly protein [Phaeobacter inhibens]
MDELPDYLTLDSNGEEDSISVSLLKGVTVDGEKRTTLTLREPSVGDYIAARQTGKNDSALAEVILIANLAEVPPDAIKFSKMKDYDRLQEALGFLNG